LLAILASLFTTLLVPKNSSWAVRAVAGWDAGATVLLVLTWWIIVGSGPHRTRRRAAAQDPGRTAIWGIVIISSFFSLFAAAGMLRSARHLAPSQAVLLAGLCLGAVVSAWLLTHTAYALRYAHLYYRIDAEGEGGLSFPGDSPPDDWDFAYFAFTLGMCFQVSDVTISSRTIRRYALVHAVLSFAYNTAIVALALNLVFGLLG
jgi:uncharacterized membrane protein